jgi:hypothetical protein
LTFVIFQTKDWFEKKVIFNINRKFELSHNF